MNKKGFTLIELLAVIVILGIILAIAVPSVVGIIERSKEQTFEKQLILIEDATRKYMTFSHETVEWETDPYDSESKTAKVTLKDLQSAGLFDERLKNPKGGEFSPEETVVLVTKKGVNYSYEVLTPGGPTPTFCFTFDPDRQMIIDYDEENPLCLSDVVIPSKINGVAVKEIGEYAFEYNNLTSVVLPDGLVKIGEGAFYGNQIANLNIPSSVTTIEGAAFDMNQLTHINIPNSVTTIGYSAFSYNQLTNISIPSGITEIDSSVFSNNQIVSVVIPENVTTIRYYAFRNNKIASLTIPASVTTIEYQAFNNNQLPDSQAFIYARNSDGSEDKTTIVSYGGVKRSNIVVPNGVTKIGHSAFADNQLTSVIIPASVKTIEYSAFRFNQLTRITIEGTNTTIEDNVLGKDNNYFREAYLLGGAGTYIGTQNGTWTKE